MEKTEKSGKTLKLFIFQDGNNFPPSYFLKYFLIEEKFTEN